MGDATERSLGKLEEGLQRVSNQVTALQTDVLEVIRSQSAMAQEILNLKERRSEDKSQSKNNLSTVFTILALIISAVALLAQVMKP